MGVKYANVLESDFSHYHEGYSPRHLDFEVLSEIQPLFFLFKFPQQILILYEPNQSLMQSKL